MSTFVKMVQCPNHEDHKPSAGLYSDGHLYCFTCNHYSQGHCTPVEAREERKDPPAPTWGMVEAYQKNLNGIFKHRKSWLHGRGLTDATIEKLKFGHSGKAFTIPVWNNELQTIRYRRDDRLAGDEAPKYKGLSGSKRTLYGSWQDWTYRVVLLCEGELDAALLMQEMWRAGLDHYVALALTGGALGLTFELAASLALAPKILLAFDQDIPGQNGASYSASYLAPIKRRVVRLTWPIEHGKDVTEAVNTLGFDKWWEISGAGSE